MGWWFTVFLGSSAAFLLWGNRMQQLAPLAFRPVRIFGFTCSACVALALARDNCDLAGVLETGDLPDTLMADLRRGVQLDSILIVLYTTMFTSAAALAARGALSI